LLLHQKFAQHVLDEALKNDIHIETGECVDINIVNKLLDEGKIKKTSTSLASGFKRDEYILNIADYHK
jgi:arginine decarboxylase